MIKGSRGNKYKERRPVQLVGQRFTRLVVVVDLGLRPRGDGLSQRWWLCQCDCGKTAETTTTNLKQGSTKSCGCYGAERRRETSIAALTKHGKATVNNKAAEYNVFATMHARCYNPKSHQYPRCVAEWSELSGLQSATILQRVRAGWPSDRLLIPVTKGANAIRR